MATPQGYRGEGVIANFWALVEHFRITMFSGVPTVYSALLQTPIAGRNIKSLEAAICGAAPMPVQLFHAFQRETGVRILEGYGLTEGACASSSTPLEAPPRIGSIGLRFPYQDMRALILNDDEPICSRRADRRDRRHRHPRAQRLRRLSRSGAQQRDLDRARRRDLAEHRRSRPAGRRRLLLAHRAQEGADHPRRPQHRSEADRGRPAVASGRRLDRGDRKPGRARRRIARRLCSAQGRRRRHRGGAPRARGAVDPRKGGDPEARQDLAVPADDGGRQALQAGAHRARDRGGHSRRGREGRRSDRIGQNRARPAKRVFEPSSRPMPTAKVSRRRSIDTHSHRR